MRTKRPGFFINISDEEKQMIHELRSMYSINISNLLRLHINETYKRLKNEQSGSAKTATKAVAKVELEGVL